MRNPEHSGAVAGAGTPSRGLPQEPRKGEVVCPRAGAERAMRYGQVVRFYQKGKVELTRILHGLHT